MYFCPHFGDKNSNKKRKRPHVLQVVLAGTVINLVIFGLWLLYG